MVLLGRYQEHTVVVKQANLRNVKINQQYIEEFVREAEISYIASGHENIVKFIGACVDLDNPRLAFQFKTGGSLEKVLLDERRFMSEKEEDVKLVSALYHG